MKHFVRILPLVALATYLLAQPAFAQQPQSPPVEKPLTLQQVLALVEDGVNVADIREEVEKRKLGFVVSGDVVEQLRNLGVPKSIIQFMSKYGIPLTPAVAEVIKQFSEERYERVIESATVVIKQSPQRLVPIWLRGISYLERENYAEALNDFQWLLDEAPDDYPNYPFIKTPQYPVSMVAKTYRLMNQPAKSVTLLSEFLARRSGLSSLQGVYLERGLAFADLKDFSSARSDFLASLKAGPGDRENYVTIANLLTTWGTSRDRDADSARTLGRVAVEFGGSAAQMSAARFAMAAAQAGLGNFDAAIDEQQKAIIGAPASRVREYEDRLAAYRRRERPWDDATKPDTGAATPNVDIRLQLFNSLVRIEGGKFLMGSDGGAPNEKPVHEVNVEPFLLGRHEVTRRQWRAVMGDAPPGSADLPMDNVSWEQCQDFIARLNRGFEGETAFFRLPTEAEWECAARAGSDERYYFGDGAENIGEHAWCGESPDSGLRSVGQRKPNPAGLYDVYGNVAEWCADDYTNYDPTVPAGNSDQLKVLRGGSWTNSPARCTSSARAVAPTKERRRGWGLRLAAVDRPLPKITTTTKTVGPSAAPRQNFLDLAIDTLVDEVHEADPRVRNQRRINLAILLTIRGYAQHADKNPAGALQSFTEAREHFADLNPVATWQARCLAAWVQATSMPSDRPVYDPRAAAEAATTAVGLTAFKHWLPYTVFAAAEAELGDFTKAETRAKQALAQVPPTFRDECQRRLAAYQARRTSQGEPLPWPLELIGMTAPPVTEGSK